MMVSSNAVPNTPSIFRTVSTPPCPSWADCAAIFIPFAVTLVADKLIAIPVVAPEKRIWSKASRPCTAGSKSSPPSIISLPAPPSMKSKPPSPPRRILSASLPMRKSLSSEPVMFSMLTNVAVLPKISPSPAATSTPNKFCEAFDRLTRTPTLPLIG